MREIKHVIIHCAATPNGKHFDVADIDRWHRERGWNGVGYHYVVTVTGEIQLGRPVEVIGAHVPGQNATSIGICMIGTDKFTAQQWLSLSSLYDKLTAEFPDAEWLGHRDFSPDMNGDGIIQPWEWTKTCPGFDVRDWIARGTPIYLEALL